MRHFAAQLRHHRFCHAVQVHPVAGELGAAKSGIAVVVVAGHCHILRHPVAVALEGLYQIIGHRIAVADKGVRHFVGQRKGDEHSLIIPVLQPPVIPDGQTGTEHRLDVAQIPVHDGTGGQHAANKADVSPPGGDKVLGHSVAAAGVVAEHAVGGNGIVVEVQQHKGHAGLHRRSKVAAADLAHKNQAVHLPVYKEGGHIAAFFCLRQNDLHQNRDVLLGSTSEYRPVQIRIKGILIEKAICHQNADALAAGVGVGPGGGLVAHLLGGGKDLGTHLGAYALLPRQTLGNGNGADAQPLCNVRHAYCFCHVPDQLSS